MRKAKPKKRVILPDPVFNDKKVSNFVNHLMYDGKKSKSYEIFYNALDTVKAKMKDNEKAKKAARATEDLSIFMTSEKVNGDELVQLVVVDQNTGKEVKSFRLSDDKNVVYEIDFNSNTVYAVDGGKLKAIKY